MSKVISLNEETRQRDQARLRAAFGVFAVVVLAVIAGLVWAGHQTAPSNPGSGEDAGAAAAGAPPAAGPQPGAESGGWDLARQAELATRPMPAFPDQAALPATLARGAGHPAMTVPGGTRAGLVVPEGFPGTPEGAVGQLAALLEVGLRDANPRSFDAAYRSVSLPGAPDPASTPLGTDVRSLHAQAVTAASDPTPVASRWQLAGALIKGETDGGRFVVACVLGELQVVKVNSISAGTGDCQAMRWTGSDWRISPGPAAARAPVVWPGSTEFVQAGYRPIQQPARDGGAR